MGLERYRRKRDFTGTPEPRGRRHPPGRRASFVIQRHAASRLHYDFRLELDGVLKSWAVPKRPTAVDGQKRLAVHVEDHPLEYGRFEGAIPAGHYGAGRVAIWDRGWWEPRGSARAGYRKGALKFRLHGRRLTGGWALVRISGRDGDRGRKIWLLIKERDGADSPGRSAAPRPIPRPSGRGRSRPDRTR